MKQKLVGQILFMALCVFSLAAQGGTLYRWVDEAGHVTFQETPPPSSVKKVDEVEWRSDNRVTKKAVQLPTVSVYVIDDCDDCKQLIETLAKWAIPFVRYNPIGSPEISDRMQSMFGKVEVPIITIGDSIVRGFNIPWLRSELTAAGFEPKE